MNLVVNRTWYEALPDWKKTLIRNAGVDLRLGTPATGDINGTEVFVFSDGRFRPDHAYAFGALITALETAPDVIPETTTPQDAMDFAGVDQMTARFFDPLPAGWNPDTSQ